MFTYIRNLLTGYLTLELVGISPERFFNMCMHHKIKLWNLDMISDIYTYSMSIKDYKRSISLIKKCDVKVKIIGKYGIPFLYTRYRKRKIFLAGLMFCIASIYLMSLRIWDIEINGNQFYTDETLVEFLILNKVQLSMLHSQIDCDEIETLIRQEYNNIIWVSAHIEGTKLLINVKENSISNSYTNDTSNNEFTVNGYDIVADCDGTVDSIITRIGTPLVHEGDQIKKGDVLVSGCLEIMSDYDEIIAYQYVDSQAEIILKTTYNYSDSEPLIYKKKIYSEKDDYYFSIKYNDTFMQVFHNVDTSLDNEVCDVVSKAIQITPNQQKIFEFYLLIDHVRYYKFVEKSHTKSEVQKTLSERFQIYCNDLKEKKVEILENNVKIQVDENMAIASGSVQVLCNSTNKVLTEIRELPIIDKEEGTAE